MGDIVVLTAGSMRMAVEMIDNEKVSTVWCNEGVIGRDSFSPILLKKWEYREEDKTRPPRANASRGYDKKDSRDPARQEKPRGNLELTQTTSNAITQNQLEPT